MPDQATCPICPAFLPAQATACTDCGFPIAPTSTSEKPRIEITGYDPFLPAGSVSGFALGLENVPDDYETATVEFSGNCFPELSDAIDAIEMDLKNGNRQCNTGVIFSKGGNIPISLAVCFRTRENEAFHFRGELLMPALDNTWNSEILKKYLKGLRLELGNEGGLVRIEGLPDNVEELKVDTTEGITRIFGNDTKNNKPNLTFSVELTPCTPPTVEAAQSTRQMRLHFSHSDSGTQVVEVFCQAQVCLGREGDIQIAPEYNTISRRHAIIHCRNAGFFLENHSANLTFVNNAQIHEETRLQAGDQFSLNRRVICEVTELDEFHLRLQMDGLNCLLLSPGIDQVQTIDDLPISHQDEGFWLHGASGQRILRNSQPLKDNERLGLHDGDELDCEGQRIRVEIPSVSDPT